MNTLQSPSKFLLAILEGFLDGILVVTTQKQLLYINNPAYRICQRLQNHATTQAIPGEIWQVCESLLTTHETHPPKMTGMETDLQCGEITLRVRVQWLLVEGMDYPCILIRLQNQHESLQSMAIAEAQTWHLTTRETEVWTLRRTGLRRKQIAAELYISEDTVKKHLGNVKAKRDSYLDEAAWQEQSQPRQYSA
jgi:DNA-binding CsgD family transcriptional regulator